MRPDKRCIALEETVSLFLSEPTADKHPAGKDKGKNATTNAKFVLARLNCIAVHFNNGSSLRF